MRIIAGQWKGITLYGGRSKEIRPLTDRIKESVFGILGDRVVNVTIIDLFAGSGSFGIEALSRGASFVGFCEKSTIAANIIRKNLKNSRCHIDHYEIVVADVFKTLLVYSQNKAQFDVIFVDPPFKTPIGKKMLTSLSDYALLAPKGILLYRHFKKESVPERVGTCILTRQKTYGDSVVKFYQRVEL